MEEVLQEVKEMLGDQAPPVEVVSFGVVAEDVGIFLVGIEVAVVEGGVEEEVDTEMNSMGTQFTRKTALQR